MQSVEREISGRVLSRRAFVTAAGVAAVGVTVLPDGAGLVFASSLPGERNLDSLHLDAFQACLGQRFRVRHKNGGVALDLVKARKSGPKAGRPAGSECFELEFRQIYGPKLPQGTYPIASDSLGSFTLFIVPDGKSGRSYVAIINRIKHA